MFMVFSIIFHDIRIFKFKSIISCCYLSDGIVHTIYLFIKIVNQNLTNSTFEPTGFDGFAVSSKYYQDLELREQSELL